MLHLRSLCALSSLLWAVPACAADPPPATETVIILSLHPQSAPKPALKYALLPELKELNPGNAVQEYLKSFMEQNTFFFGKESVADRDKWLDVPLKDLPDLKEYGGSALRQVDYAARMEHCDWQVVSRLKVEGMMMLLPDIQRLRLLAVTLKVRYRGAVKDQRFEDAIRTHKTMFGMARDLQEHPTLIGNLVGLAIANIPISPLEELIQQPGCPNLFWAITNLPNPLVGIRKGIEAERVMVFADLRKILENDEPVSDSKLQAYREKFRFFHAMSEPEGKAKINASEWLKKRAANEAVLKAAKSRLIASGITEEKLKNWPPLQLVIRDEYHRYEMQRDEMIKWANVSYPEALEGMRKVEEVIKAIGQTKVAEDDPDASLMVNWAPLVLKVYLAQLRLQQRLALLQNVEAIRMYAAENAGKFPAKLENIKLPLLVDPFTGKAFIYKVDEGKAVLQGTPPKGMEKNVGYNVRYEITLKK